MEMEMKKLKKTFVVYCQKSAELAVEAWGNSPPPVEEELLLVEDETRELMIVPMVQGEGTVVDSEVGEILFIPFIEGDVIVEPAVQRKMRPAPLLAKKRPRRSDAKKTPVAEGDEEEGEEMTYCGVRKRFGNKYVVEIHNSILKERVWLGTYDKAEMGAWVYDTAARVLRRSMAETNFPSPRAGARADGGYARDARILRRSSPQAPPTRGDG
uniref:AP2/ERF domain-containing protein n=1 Tax=Leersia perrieri TaxID=77586 RepID=A0A0D9WSD8_9ORYZ